MIQSGTWTAGNTIELIELLSTGLRTGASSVSARNAAVDVTHAFEDYKCLILDCAATICDITVAVAAFIPVNMTKQVF